MPSFRGGHKSSVVRYLGKIEEENLRREEGEWAELDETKVSDPKVDIAGGVENKLLVEEVLSSLPPRWGKVLELTLLEDESLTETGRRMNLTSERIRQIKTEAIERLNRIGRERGFF